MGPIINRPCIFMEAFLRATRILIEPICAYKLRVGKMNNKYNLTLEVMFVFRFRIRLSTVLVLINMRQDKLCHRTKLMCDCSEPEFGGGGEKRRN